MRRIQRGTRRQPHPRLRCESSVQDTAGTYSGVPAVGSLPWASFRECPSIERSPGVIAGSGYRTQTLTMQKRSIRACLAAVGLGCLVAVSGGCKTIEGSTTWDLTLRNDAGRTAVVKYCSTNACDHFKYTRRLAPRGSAAVFDYSDGTSWWVVLDGRRKRLGCLKLDRSQRVEGYVLRTSNLTECP